MFLSRYQILLKTNSSESPIQLNAFFLQKSPLIHPLCSIVYTGLNRASTIHLSLKPQILPYADIFNPKNILSTEDKKFLNYLQPHRKSQSIFFANTPFCLRTTL